MPMSPSSTSSSRAAYSRLARVALIVAVIFGAAEATARVVLSGQDAWQFWDHSVAANVSHLRKLVDEGFEPSVLFLGDSTAASNFSPLDFERTSGKVAYNLGSPGNFSAAFDVTMLNSLLPSFGLTPDTYMLSWSPGTWTEGTKHHEEVILASPLAKEAEGERVWARYFALTRVQHLLRLSLFPVLSNQTIYEENGFQPWGTGPRQRMCTGCGKKVQRLARQVRGVVGGAPPPPTPEEQAVIPDPERLAVLGALLERVHEEGARAIILVPPNSRPHPEYIEALAELAVGTDALVWDTEAAPFKRTMGAHLGKAGARRYSAVLGQKLRELERGRGQRGSTVVRLWTKRR